MRSDSIGSAHISTGTILPEEPQCGTDSIDGLQMFLPNYVLLALWGPFGNFRDSWAHDSNGLISALALMASSRWRV